MDFLNRLSVIFLKWQKNLRRWHRVVLALAMVVVFVTTYALILPAITLDQESAEEMPGIEPSQVETAEEAETQEASQTEETEAAQEPSQAEEAGIIPDTAQTEGTEKTEDASQQEETEDPAVQEGTESDEEPIQEEILEEPEYKDGSLLYEGWGDQGDYTITVSYSAQAMIPEGAFLQVQEIEAQTELFDSYLNQTIDALEEEAEEGDTVQVGFVRFFDISIWLGEEKIEPSEPVEVSIIYDEVPQLEEEETMQVVHFVPEGTEIIRDVEVSEDGSEMTYMQGSFSVIGTVSSSTYNNNNWPLAGNYVMVLNVQGSSDYYAVDRNGTLSPVLYDPVERQVTFENANAVADLNGYIWQIQLAGTSHRIANTLGQYITLTNGVVMSTSTGTTPAITNGYITVGRASNRYYLALDLENMKITSRQAINNNGVVSYPDNPANVYYVSENSLSVTGQSSQYSGRGFDRAALEEWARNLTERVPPLTDLDKTAEVYDYENRVYQIDLKAKSGVDTFVNDIDLAFMLDFSNSMLFAPRLHPVGMATVLTQDNLNAMVESGQLDPNKRYFVIADKNGTATHYIIYRYDYDSDPTSDKSGQANVLQGFNGKWVYYDASFYAKTHSGVNGYQSIATDGKWRYPTMIPESNASNFRIDIQDGNGFIYALYTADDSFYDGMTRNSIYSTVSPGYNRLYYLKDGVKDSIRNIIEIALKDSRLDLETKTVRSAYNLFWGTVGRTQDFMELTNEEGATNNYNTLVETLEQGITDGGTRQDLAMARAGDSFDWNSSASKYAILITDGAPLQNGVSTEQLNSQLVTAAANLKAQGITLITVGVSMREVTNGQYILHEIASVDGNGVPYFYEIDSAEDLKYVLYDILQRMTAEAVVASDITDTIDPAFYPVAADGTPLKAGDRINLEGQKSANGPGLVAYENGAWTVTWDDQDIPWDGWEGRVYVKAKEDFLGGNTINTNQNDARITAESYTLTGLDAQGQPITETVDLTQMDLSKRSYSLETPYVNVDELTFTENETEWTVYLGTEVDPLAEVKKLLEVIEVEEVVTASSDHMIQAASAMAYPLTQSAEDGRTMTADQVETIPLSTYTGNLTEDDWSALLAGDAVEVPYSAYGHSPGTITLSLTQTVASGETDLRVSPHETMVTGAPVETYVLTVQYTPQDPIEVAYHTGEEGTKSPGPSANEIESENTHIINVFAKQLRLRKTDMNQGVINYAGASFNLYRKAAAGESGQEVEGLTGTYVLIDTLVTDQGGLTGTSCDLKALDSGETYFLTETAAPPGFIPFAGAIAVQTSVRDTYEKVLENAVDGEEPIGFDWNQTASIVLANPTYAVLSGAQAGASQTYDQTTIEVTYDIMNSNGYALPHTGAAGTASYRVSGLMLILLASLTACFRARHGERRKKGL